MARADHLARKAAHWRRVTNLRKRAEIARKFPPNESDIKELQRLAADAVAKQLLAKERSDS